MTISKKKVDKLHPKTVPIEKKLTREQVFELAKRAEEGDKEAEHQLILGHLGLVKFMVSKFLNRGLPYDDLFQEGCIALIEAVKNYDYRRELMFSTYANHYIFRNIQRALIKAEPIRKPEDLWHDINRYQHTLSNLKILFNRIPTDREVAEEMKITPERLSRIKEKIFYYTLIDGSENDQAMNEYMDTPGLTLTNAMPEPVYREVLIDEEVFQDMFLIDFMGMETVLTEREEKILSLRFANRGRNMTYKEISERIGGTPEGVRIACKKALQKLRDFLETNSLEY